MSEIIWTSDQKTAIDTTDKGVVVSAAAGSGKTAVLIERIIRLLESREKNIPADRLLAVTFTVDAAAQMREKLAEAFEKRLENVSDVQQKKWLQKQQDRLALAKISTINSFCLELVRNNIHEFDVQDGLKIIDENDAAVVVKGAISSSLDKLAEQNAADMDMLVDALTDNSESALEDIVYQLYDFLRSLPFPDEWIEKCERSFTDKERIADYVMVAAYEYQDYADKALKLNELCREDFFRINEKYDGILSEKIAVMLNDDESLIRKVKKVCENGSWQEIRKTVSAVKFSTKPRIKLDENTPPEVVDVWNMIGDRRDKAKEELKKISRSADRAGDEIEKDLLYAKKIFGVLCGVCKDAENFAWEEKKRKNAVEFSDVERMAIKLLVTKENGVMKRTALADEIVKNGDYKVILIDEFQDVNNLQELIFKTLSDTDDLNVMGKNIFVVGDVKQSIYRFRQSNPALFINAKEMAAQEEYSDRLKLVELKSNYRSRRNIIDFVNFIFENIMSREVGELEYEGGERLVCGAKYGGDDHDTEIILVKTDDQQDADSDEGKYYAENLAAARKIREMIDSKTPVYKGDECRPCRPSDFCILARNYSITARMADALAEVGLKAHTEDDSGYLRSREIAVMINLLKVIDNPMRDIPLTSVMMSSVMDFSADDTARLRKLCIKENGRKSHLYQILNAAAKNSDAHEKESERLELDDDVLEEKCRRAVELIGRLRFYASGMTLSRLIRRIYDETEMFAAASGYENSRQKRANLRMLLEYAAAYESSGEGGVTGFLRYISSVSENGGDFKQAVTVTEGSDSVIIKTIHKSKGLEFPFVFLCGVTKIFNEQDVKKNMLLDENYGIGFKLLDHEKLTKTETISFKALSYLIRSKLLSEEIRLLYVALTRAKEKIFIPITVAEGGSAVSDIKKQTQELAGEIALAGGINSRIISGANSYYKWLAAVLLCCENNEVFLREMGVDIELPQLLTNARISFSVANRQRESADAGDFYCGKPQIETVSRLKKIFRGEIEEEKIIPSKLTVTEIVREEKEREYGEKNPEFFPQLPRLSEEIDKQTAAQRGTCTHLFMELADYANAASSVKDELKRLTDGGYFSKKEADGVYVSALESFFAGDFYKRMSASEEIIREKQFLVSFADLALDSKYSDYISGGTMLQGVADCIFKEADGYVLVDYKTDNFKDISQLYGYKTQLELYKAALDRLLDMPIKACYIYSFRLSEGVEISL